VDELVGSLLRALEETGRSEQTTVLFTSDHGDHLGQHAMYQKMEMYEQAVRVPLLVRHPGASPRTVDTPISHLDLMPTLLDLFGVSHPVGLSGRSIASAIDRGEPLEDRPVFSAYSGNPTVGDIRRAVITRRYKYVYDPDDSPELYDLQSDPLETVNLATDTVSWGHKVRELHEIGRKWALEQGDWVTW